jgi:hypothetical protein
VVRLAYWWLVPVVWLKPKNTAQEVPLSIHVFVRFEPRPGKEEEFREELLRVVEPTRAESGCLAIHAFEALQEPFVFTIHSE